MIVTASIEPQEKPKWKRLYPITRRADAYPSKWDTVSAPKHNILEALCRYRFLTARQLRDVLGYSTGKEGRIGSLTFVRDQTKELYHAGYIDKLPFVPMLGKGRLPDVFILDRKGYRYLKGQGIEPQGRERTSEKQEVNWMFIEHIMASNDLVIMCERLARQSDGVTLAAFKTERDLRVNPIKVVTTVTIEDQGKAKEKQIDITLVPDAWVDLRIGQSQQAIAFELDRDTEKREKVQKKIFGYLEAFRGAYKAKFGTSSVTVAFVAAEGGQRRVDQLTAWIEEALAKRGAESYGDLFRISAFDTQIGNPRYYFASIWRKPFDSANFYPLLERG